MPHLRRRLAVSAAAAALAVLGALPQAPSAALAQDGAVPGTAADRKAVKPVAPLTTSQIEAFIASIPDVQRWAMAQDGPMRELTERRFGAGTLAATPFAVGLQQIQGTQAYDQLTDTVRGHGFTEPEMWAATADRVIRALAALQMEESGPTPDQLDQTRRKVLNDPTLSAAEKEQILSSVGMATAMQTAPTEDVEAVSPFAEQLAETLKPAQ